MISYFFFLLTFQKPELKWKTIEALTNIQQLSNRNMYLYTIMYVYAVCRYEMYVGKVVQCTPKHFNRFFFPDEGVTLERFLSVFKGLFYLSQNALRHHELFFWGEHIEINIIWAYYVFWFLSTFYVQSVKP